MGNHGQSLQCEPKGAFNEGVKQRVDQTDVMYRMMANNSIALSSDGYHVILIISITEKYGNQQMKYTVAMIAKTKIHFLSLTFFSWNLSVAQSFGSPGILRLEIALNNFL